MTGSPLVVGVDLGSSGFRALALGPDGRVVAKAAHPTPLHRVPTGAEMSAEEFQAALGATVSSLEVDYGRVLAIAVAGMAEAGIGLGADGLPVTPIPAWYDARGTSRAMRVLATVPRDTWALTGRPPRAKSSAALASALADSGSPIAAWLGLPEYACHLLSGERVSVASLAARTGAWDLVGERYSPAMLDAFHLPADMFPPVLPAAAQTGRAQTEFASRLGLSPETRIVVAGHDHPVGALALGTIDRLTAIDSVGTAEQILRRVTTLPDLDVIVDLGLEASRAPDEDGWLITGCRRRPGLVLAGLAEHLDLPREDLERDSPPERTVARDERDAIERFMSGEPTRLPESLHDAPHAAWDTALTALAQDAADLTRELDALLGPARRIVVSGGGVRSARWMRAKQRVSSHPLEISTVTDATVLGAAQIAGRVIGW